MTWLTVTEYLCHKWPRVCSVWPQFGPFLIHDLFSNSSYHLVCNKSSITYGTGTDYPSEAPEFTPFFSLIRIARSVVFCVMFCLCFFCPFVPLCCLSFFNIRLLNTTLVSCGNCFVCHSSTYGIWIPFWYILWPLCCLSFFNILLLNTPLVSCGYCVVCHSSTYGFWIPLWYLVAIVLSVIL